jgi:hypothetical protein
MVFRRPMIPSRGLEMICFIFSAFAFIGMSIFLVSAFARGLVSWRGIALLELLTMVAVLPTVAIGTLLRWKRMQKLDELREYERVLALASLRN